MRRISTKRKLAISVISSLVIVFCFFAVLQQWLEFRNIEYVEMNMEIVPDKIYQFRDIRDKKFIIKQLKSLIKEEKNYDVKANCDCSSLGLSFRIFRKDKSCEEIHVALYDYENYLALYDFNKYLVDQ